MHIFDKTTYHKELILKNRKNYSLKARKQEKIQFNNFKN